MFRVFFLIAALAVPLAAQVPQRRPVVRANGEGIVSIRPDQVKVSVGVTNQAGTAQEAADQNATVTNNVLAALRQLLGATADVKTLGYSLNPIYSNTPGSNRPIVGYQATNTIEVTLNDTSLAGRVIDVAAQAGATNVNALRFGLRDPNPTRIQALRAAALQARQKAESIATALGGRVGQVLIAEEGSTVTPIPVDSRSIGLAAGSTPTTIEAGTLEVRAYVAIEAELTQ
ncbi:MAG: SIMPL domain-containing protein [Bryobacterales bacterium]|nr:SIMPL domain-containing protein [Bryobacterales bacterium]